MIRFFSPDIASLATLPEAESHHCCKVLRHQCGDIIEVVDGRGNLYQCRLVEAHPRHAQVEIISHTPLPPHWPFDITLAVAPTKHLDRMEWLTEKITEIGCSRLIPLLADRSERRDIKTDRLLKTALAAMKQSLKAQMPVIDPLTTAKQAIAQATQPQRFICHCIDRMERISLPRAITPGQDIIVMIGPEGDFSPTEVKLALDNGFRPITLGPARLRTETAALVALTAIHTVNQLHSH